MAVDMKLILEGRDTESGKVGRSTVEFTVDHDERDSVQEELEGVVRGWRKASADKRKAGK